MTITRHESTPMSPTGQAQVAATTTTVDAPGRPRGGPALRPVGVLALVGQVVAIGDDDPAWALARARELRGGAWSPPPGDGAALRAVLLERRAVIPFDQAERGDLLLFERPVEAGVASTWAVVLGRDPRGVIEILYVASTRVRRGFVDPARPTVKRDRDRRVVNTYLRHDRRTPSDGHHFLAGELLALAARLPHNG